MEQDRLLDRIELNPTTLMKGALDVAAAREGQERNLHIPIHFTANRGSKMTKLILIDVRKTEKLLFDYTSHSPHLHSGYQKKVTVCQS